MNWWNKAKEFLSEVRAEMRKVSFPSRDEVMATTIVVLITSVVFAVFLFLADQLIVRGYQGIIFASKKVF
jgi:preprotein translocase subunit SecE